MRVTMSKQSGRRVKGTSGQVSEGEAESVRVTTSKQSERRRVGPGRRRRRVCTGDYEPTVRTGRGVRPCQVGGEETARVHGSL